MTIGVIKQVIRRHFKVAAFAVLGVLVGLLLTSQSFEYLANFKAELGLEQVETTLSEISGPVLSEASPIKLRIPKIGVDTSFETEALGLTDNNEPEVPEGYEMVGWYGYGPTPGELGPAVVLGHVDSFDGPAVFYRLGQLEEGDEIYVDREDGTTAVFAVTDYERPSQEDFPFARVYSDINHAGLRLITCTGTYDKGEQRYSHNLIVYAKLIEKS